LSSNFVVEESDNPYERRASRQSGTGRLCSRYQLRQLTESRGRTPGNYDGILLRTTDGGATWTNQSYNTNLALYGVRFTDASHRIVLSPCFQQPLVLGADVVIHSATKFLGGHSDVTAGALITNDAELYRQFAFQQNAEGAGLAPFDSWLLLRGINTLALRAERQNASANTIARFLSEHAAVEQVYYPGLSTHGDHELHRRQATGDGAVISFTTGDALRLAARRFEYATIRHRGQLRLGELGDQPAVCNVARQHSGIAEANVFTTSRPRPHIRRNRRRGRFDRRLGARVCDCLAAAGCARHSLEYRTMPLCSVKMQACFGCDFLLESQRVC
jgi:Cys/Met metabolism PLP-dependent enzyme